MSFGSMKTVWCCALFLALSTVTCAKVEGCTLEPVGAEQVVKVLYTTSTVSSGCVSRRPADANLEVHILHLKYSDPSQALTKLNVSLAKGAVGCNHKTVFVLNSNSTFALLVQTEDCPISFISKEPSFVHPNRNVTMMDLPASSEELLNWARRTYGGVSSFAVLENPQHIHFQVGREPSTPENCVPESNFDAGEYLEVEVFSSEIKSCLGPGGPLRETAHVLWLEQGPRDSATQVVDVSVKRTCKGGEQRLLLVLRGQPGILWTINQMSDYMQFWASGKLSFNQISPRFLPEMALPDTIEGLIEKIDPVNRSIASFTVISSAKSITLDVLKCEPPPAATTAAATSPPAAVTPTPSLLETLVKMLKPWRCTDHGLEIALAKFNLLALPSVTLTEITLDDPSCKARENTTHFFLSSAFDNCKTHLEGGIHAKNQLILTQASTPDKVTVPFQCDLPEKLRLQLYRSPDFAPSSSTTSVEVDKVTYVQVSLRTAEKAPLMPYDCLLQPSGMVPSQQLIREGLPLTHVEIFPDSSPKTSHFSFTYKGKGVVLSATLFCKMYLKSEKEMRFFNGSLEVKIESPSPPPHNQGLGIGAVLGITFGAFLIGVLLTAALWYIYSHTRVMAKTQPAVATLPASESSSSNHSVGSTQSTPCSTSSMA
ncbi:endoglin isoform X2 [Tiliqua scincoides]|uniref:endoglin isoform X2 n=1 Tax=Tiliqua scincoides TaxID=71010 RepID=UPI003462ACA8